MAKSLGVEVAEGAAEGNDCILCGLCTRTCHEIVGVDALKFVDRGLGRNVSEPEDRVYRRCLHRLRRPAPMCAPRDS